MSAGWPSASRIVHPTQTCFRPAFSSRIFPPADAGGIGPLFSRDPPDVRPTAGCKHPGARSSYCWDRGTCSKEGQAVYILSMAQAFSDSCTRPPPPPGLESTRPNLPLPGGVGRSRLMQPPRPPSGSSTPPLAVAGCPTSNWVTFQMAMQQTANIWFTPSSTIKYRC